MRAWRPGHRFQGHFKGLLRVPVLVVIWLIMHLQVSFTSVLRGTNLSLFDMMHVPAWNVLNPRPLWVFLLSIV